MTLTEYEIERQRRLEANERRLKELGLKQMVEELAAEHAASQPAKRRKRDKNAARVLLPHEIEPTRRSKRNEGKEQPNYRLMAERESPRERRDPNAPLVKDGEVPELYAVRHVKALGSYKKPWIMFQDGYNEQGERVYDSEKGVTCHQCRQKTLGQHTSCSRCKSGQGALCGDCLFARYGENVEEAAANPEWVCPCCRDLCNCSRHRKLRKWEATGMLHHRVKARGYLSVAHYLVLNKLGSTAAKRAALESGFCPSDLEEKLQEEVEAAGDESAVDSGLELELEERPALAPAPADADAGAPGPATAPAGDDVHAPAGSNGKKKRNRSRSKKQASLEAAGAGGKGPAVGSGKRKGRKGKGAHAEAAAPGQAAGAHKASKKGSKRRSKVEGSAQDGGDKPKRKMNAGVQHKASRMSKAAAAKMGFKKTAVAAKQAAA